MLKGNKLKEHLNDMICENLGISNDVNNIKIDKFFECEEIESLNNGNTICCFGEYQEEHQQSKSEYFTNRFIVLFERKEHNILNDIIGIEPGYLIKYIRVSGNKYNYPYSFYLCNNETADLDNDGELEISLSFKHHFADRITKSNVILDKINNEWNIIDIPFDNMLKTETKNNYTSYKYISNDNKEYDVFLNKFEMRNPKDEKDIDNIYFITEDMYADDSMFTIENVIDSRICYLFRIPVMSKEEAVLTRTSAIYGSLLYENGNFCNNENWNNGELYITYYKELSKDKIDEIWGIEKIKGDKVSYNIHFYK